MMSTYIGISVRVYTICHFYHPMHCSAKRSIEVACRPSVRPSVCDVNESESYRLEILKINCTDNYFNTLALRRPKVIHVFPGEHWEFLGRLEVGWEKAACWSTKAAICLKRVKIEEKLLWGATWHSPTLFRTVRFPTPYAPKYFGYPYLRNG